MTVTVGTDTYLSVTGADTYCENLGKTAWDEASESAKEVALRQATQYLDANFRWTGFLYDSDQALGWPRTGAYDAEGRELTDIPSKVEDACAELAFLALGGDLNPMSLPETGGRISREKIGQIDVEYDLTDKGRQPYSVVVGLLAGIGTFRGAARTVKVVR